MTATVLAEPPVVAVEATARTRRWGRWVFLLAGLVLVAGGLFAGVISTVRFAGDAPVTFTTTGDAVTLPGFGERGAHVLAYAHGEAITFSFPLHNDSRVPVSVDGITLGDDRRQSLLAVEGVLADGQPLPVSVDAGDTVTVTVTARYANCRYYHEREIESVRDVGVSGSALGVGVDRRVSLDHDLVVHSPMVVGCPDRTLARDDDVRVP